MTFQNLLPCGYKQHKKRYIVITPHSNKFLSHVSKFSSHVSKFSSHVSKFSSHVSKMKRRLVKIKRRFNFLCYVNKILLYNHSPFKNGFIV